MVTSNVAAGVLDSEAEVSDRVCYECGGRGAIDSGAPDPQGRFIEIPCPVCASPASQHVAATSNPVELSEGESSIAHCNRCGAVVHDGEEDSYGRVICDPCNEILVQEANARCAERLAQEEIQEAFEYRLRELEEEYAEAGLAVANMKAALKEAKADFKSVEERLIKLKIGGVAGLAAEEGEDGGEQEEGGSETDHSPQADHIFAAADDTGISWRTVPIEDVCPTKMAKLLRESNGIGTLGDLAAFSDKHGGDLTALQKFGKKKAESLRDEVLPAFWAKWGQSKASDGPMESEQAEAEQVPDDDCSLSQAEADKMASGWVMKHEETVLFSPASPAEPVEEVATELPAEPPAEKPPRKKRQTKAEKEASLAAIMAYNPDNPVVIETANGDKVEIDEYGIVPSPQAANDSVPGNSDPPDSFEPDAYLDSDDNPIDPESDLGILSRADAISKAPAGTTWVHKQGPWESGVEAANRGQPVTDCAYTPGAERDSWIRGWLRAMEDE